MELNRGWVVGLLSWAAIAVLAGCARQRGEPELAQQSAAVVETPNGPVTGRHAPNPAEPSVDQPRATPRLTVAAPPRKARIASKPTAVAERVDGKPDAHQPAAPPPKNASATTPPAMPRVVLTAGHATLCRVGVGDSLPAIELEDLDGRPHKLSDLLGEKLTVICFWSSRQVLAGEELADLGPDVVAHFADRGVAVVGIAEEPTAAAARQSVTDAAASFPMLLDPTGEALGKVGTGKLPRTYLVDRQGKILWFDIEYSRATRRELSQAIRAALGG